MKSMLLGLVDLIENTDNEIQILSGEGDYGSFERYTGKRTVRAVKLRLTKERCGGDRWAFALIYSHDVEEGSVYYNLENGNPKFFFAGQFR